MTKYIIFFLTTVIIFLYGCHKVEEKTYTVQNAIEMSMRDFDKSEVTRIIRLLTNRIDNGNSKIRLTRGFYYLLIKDKKNALKDFNFILKADSNNSDAYLGIATTNLLNSDSSLYYINKALQKNPKNAFAYFVRSVLHNDNEKQLFDLNSAIKLKPDCAMFYTWRGAFYDNFIDSSSLSMKDYKRSIQLDDSIPLNYALLGLKYEVQKNYNEALKNYSLQIKVASQNSNGYENRGNLYYKQKLYEKAIEDYKRALLYISKNKFFDHKSTCYYAIAINYSLLKNDSVYHYLELTFEDDANYVNYAKVEKDFNNIKHTKRFKDIIIKYSK